MKLSEHFSLAEFTASQTATRLGIDNSLPQELYTNARRTCILLEEARQILGKPIHINSGYRCPKLNERIGGSQTSAHMQALAADFVCHEFGTPLQICQALIGKIEFDQLIEEGTWVHVGLAEGPLRNEILTARFPNGKVVYSHGLTKV